jgi:hypothetical protein
MVEDWKTIKTSDQMNALQQAWKLTNRCIKWWSIFLVCLLFIAAVAMMFGALTLEVNLDLVIVDNLTNPILALLFFALVLLGVAYPIFFAIALPIVFLLRFRANKRIDAIDD